MGCASVPGSCDERDALNACQIAATASALRAGPARCLGWFGMTDLSDVDRIVVPGGFSYGGLPSGGAIARFSPAMNAVAEFAAAGGPVWGSAATDSRFSVSQGFCLARC